MTMNLGYDIIIKKKEGRSMFVYIIGAVVLDVVVAWVAQSWGRKFSDYFLLSLFLSPLVGFIVLAFHGKATREEILDNTPHIFYCSSCGSTYSGETNVNTKCPDCNVFTVETTILRDDWRKFTQDRKEQMKELFSKGQYLRNAEVISKITKTSEGADDIKKYKELLDMGAISEEEYEAKKKQILNL